MKKVIFSILAGIVVLLSTSCNTCIECKHDYYQDQDEYCSQNKILRDSYKSGMESSGYTCN